MYNFFIYVIHKTSIGDNYVRRNYYGGRNKLKQIIMKQYTHIKQTLKYSSVNANYCSEKNILEVMYIHNLKPITNIINMKCACNH